MTEIEYFDSYPIHKGKCVCTVTPTWKNPRRGDTLFLFSSDEEFDDTFDNLGYKVVPVDKSVESVDKLNPVSLNSAFLFDRVIGIISCGDNNEGFLVENDGSCIFHVEADFANKDIMDYEVCLGSCHEVMRQVMPCASYYQQINSRPIPIGYFICDNYRRFTMIYCLYTVSSAEDLKYSFQGSKFNPNVREFKSLEDAKIEFLCKVGEQYGISKFSCGRYNLSPKDLSRGELGKERR